MHPSFMRMATAALWVMLLVMPAMRLYAQADTAHRVAPMAPVSPERDWLLGEIGMYAAMRPISMVDVGLRAGLNIYRDVLTVSVEAGYYAIPQPCLSDSAECHNTGKIYSLHAELAPIPHLRLVFSAHERWIALAHGFGGGIGYLFGGPETRGRAYVALQATLFHQTVDGDPIDNAWLISLVASGILRF